MKPERKGRVIALIMEEIGKRETLADFLGFLSRQEEANLRVAIGCALERAAQEKVIR
jgi:hypothetical protein